MCGIAGIVDAHATTPPSRETLERMIASLQHRGPDEAGIYRDGYVGMASTRLSIVDLEGGQQPIGNEDGSLWIVFNGEIFNFPDLRRDLEARGHEFDTNCDTEAVLHAYESYGPDCLTHLNGQFALAIWDANQRHLFLARDRLGIRPLFYKDHGKGLIFASEVKALAQVEGVDLELDTEALRQAFTFWAPVPPRTTFAGVKQLPPAHYLLITPDGRRTERYWQPDFEATHTASFNDTLDEFEQLLADATRIRLQADVPVGAYLSGGIDSSITASLILRSGISELDTFSVGFEEARFDETEHQRRMADFLGTSHHQIHVTNRDIGEAFPHVIRHTESPILRTAPAPLYLLSRSVHDHGYKVVLTGEGADEVLAGYGIFKEMRIRRFWAKNPASNMRPLLLQRLYPDIPGLTAAPEYLRGFFRRGLTETESPHYSHLIRWGNTSRINRFLVEDGASIASEMYDAAYPLPSRANRWSDLGRAQYLEMASFLSPYLLSSQGDRVSMAHSVEGRYPFLDHRVVEFCGRLPDSFKQRGMREKWLLKRLGERLVPKTVWSRTKQPYRAPIQKTFFPESGSLSYVEELLNPQAVRDAGMFEPDAVSKLAAKAAASRSLGEVDEMALVGILSTQLVHQQFVSGRQNVSDRPELPNLKVVDALALG